jgi:hypothetical protein
MTLSVISSPSEAAIMGLVLPVLEVHENGTLFLPSFYQCHVRKTDQFISSFSLFIAE